MTAKELYLVWQRYRAHPRWERLYESLKPVLIETMVDLGKPCITSANTLYEVGKSRGDKDCEAWLAVGLEYNYRSKQLTVRDVGEAWSVNADGVLVTR